MLAQPGDLAGTLGFDAAPGGHASASEVTDAKSSCLRCCPVAPESVSTGINNVSVIPLHWLRWVSQANATLVSVSCQWIWLLITLFQICPLSVGEVQRLYAEVEAFHEHTSERCKRPERRSDCCCSRGRPFFKGEMQVHPHTLMEPRRQFPLSQEAAASPAERLPAFSRRPRPTVPPHQPRPR